MLCFTIDSTGKLEQGIPVDFQPNDAHARMILLNPTKLVTPPEVRLDDALTQTLRDFTSTGAFSSVSRVQKCSVEKTSEIWIRPDQEGSPPAALVRCELALYAASVFRYVNKSIEIEGAHEMLEQVRFVDTTYSTRRFETDLVKLYPGSTISTFSRAGKQYAFEPCTRHQFVVEPDGSLTRIR